MKLILRQAAGAVVCILLSALHVGAQDMPARRDISRSKQFYVYCDDDNARSRITTACDDIKDRLLRVLKLRDNWKLPIVVVVRVPLSTEVNVSPWQFGVFKSEDGSKLQINLNITDGIEQTRLLDRVTEALLTEIIYRGRDTFLRETTYQKPYAWLIEGVAEKVRRFEDPIPSTVMTALLQASGKIPFREMLARDASHLDSVSHEVYRAYAMSLVEMLISQPDGSAAFYNYLLGIPERRMERMFDFASVFPSLNGGPESLNKWWALSLAKMASAEKYLPMTPALTDSKLEKILTITVPESYFPKAKPKKKKKSKEETGETATDTGELPAGGDDAEPDSTASVRILSINQFSQLTQLDKEKRKQVMSPVLTGLYGLGTTAHPMFYAIVGEYQRVVGLLSEGKTKGIEDELSRLAEIRKKVLGLYTKIDDYLNWFEATQIEVKSGVFEDYLREAKEAARAKKARRTDPINQYMDVVEAEMH